MAYWRLCLLFLFCPLLLMGQGAVSVKGEYVYYAEPGQSLKEAQLAALQGAKNDALSRAFGTAVTQQTSQRDSWVDGKESSFFSQMSDSEVRGVWIEDVGEPEYVSSLIDDMIVVKCVVRGKARPFSNEAVEFEAALLRNGTELRFASANYRSGDDLYLWFRSPVDGYVSVYLVDETLTAFCLLPYRNDNYAQCPVKKDKEYVFFSELTASQGERVDEYHLTCENVRELNQIYVIFSPILFNKANDRQIVSSLPRQLPYMEFSKWLGAQRTRDPKMNVKIMQIEITANSK